MDRKSWVLGIATSFLLAAGSARAQSVDDKIKSLEQELTQLKEQQVELKKEATAAAAALPTFEYRPGNGLNIEAADKAWGIRFTLESHFRYEFESGRTQQGRSTAEIMIISNYDFDRGHSAPFIVYLRRNAQGENTLNFRDCKPPFLPPNRRYDQSPMN